MSQLVLSIFHGLDLLGRGFEAEGFCVVRAAELELGFDVRKFTPVPDRFDGVIAGTPCNEFSLANRKTRTYHGYGKMMMDNFARVVTQSRCSWALLENVPTVPNIEIPGYSHQRFDLNATECGLEQSRLRHFQFFSAIGHVLTIDRSQHPGQSQPCVTASEGHRATGRRRLTEICTLQGLPESFELPYFRLEAKYKVVGQGVPVAMARRVAAAIHRAVTTAAWSQDTTGLCGCGCGRRVTGKQVTATVACRKRVSRKSVPGRVTWL